jgi:hypothetical protein
MSELKKPWVVIVGSVFGGLTLLFFMGLTLLAVFGHQIPCESRFLVVTIIALGSSLSVAFLGGAAAAKGAIPLPFAKSHPLSFSVSGGIGVLVILLVLSNNLFVQDCSEEPTISCPVNYQSHYISQLKFGFCYPRHGWEVDRGPIDVRAADIYVRNAANRDVSVHFHVSLIPSNYSSKHDEYSQLTANTWKQLDDNLSYTKGFLNGRYLYKFNLNVLDRNGVTRPTEVNHIFLDSEKLLEIISTKFEDTSEDISDILGKIVSSTSIYK